MRDALRSRRRKTSGTSRKRTTKAAVACPDTGKLPSGVPGLGGWQLLPPPPQLTICVMDAKTRRVSTALQRRRREDAPNRKIPAKIPPDPVAHQFSFRGLRL